MTLENNISVPLGRKVEGVRLNPEYFGFMLELLNDPAVARMEGKYAEAHDLGKQEAWFEANKNKDDRDFWVFIDKASRKPVGYFSFKEISLSPRAGHIGIKLSPAFQGKGYGKDILKAAESYYFNKRKVDKLVSHIVTFNQPSLHLFVHSCQWEIVGLKTSTVHLDGETFDQVLIELSKLNFIELEKDSFFNYEQR